MRVLHVCGMYLPATEWGGVTTAVAAYAQALAGAGVDCEVFATTARGSHDAPPIEPGTREVGDVPVTYFAARSVSQALIAPTMVPALARRIREFDLVHTHMLWAFPGIVASRAARIAGLPYIVTPHGSLDPWALSQRAQTKKVFLALSENRTLERAALVHYTATAERDAIPERFRSLRSVIIPNVIDPDAITPADRRSIAVPASASHSSAQHSSFDILILGRIHPMKGFDALIPALPAVLAAEPRARLVIAGPDEGGYRAEVERMIAAAGVGHAVRFTGHVDATERDRLFGASAVLVQPSYRENFGMAVAEAMAAELPVVVSERVNICDDIATAGAGLVVRREPSEIATALIRVLRVPGAMGVAGRALVERDYAPAVVGRAMRAAYETVLARR